MVYIQLLELYYILRYNYHLEFNYKDQRTEYTPPVAFKKLYYMNLIFK